MKNNYCRILFLTLVIISFACRAETTYPVENYAFGLSNLFPVNDPNGYDSVDEAISAAHAYVIEQVPALAGRVQVRTDFVPESPGEDSMPLWARVDYRRPDNSYTGYSISVYSGSSPWKIESQLGAEECEAPEIVCGNPINIGSRNKYQLENDIYISPLLFFNRHYNYRGSSLRGALGARWTHTYSDSIRVLVSSSSGKRRASVIRADGRNRSFFLEDGIWHAGPGVRERLTEYTDSLGQTQGWRLDDGSGLIENYDHSGRLLQRLSSAGETVSLEYDEAGRLFRAVSREGRRLLFLYDLDGRLIKVIDASGQEYVYSYTSQGMLSSVVYPDGAIRSYHYNEVEHTWGTDLPRALTGIIDESGQRFATFGYRYRLPYSTEHGVGIDKYLVNYTGVDSVKVTSPDGAVYSRSLSTYGGIRRVVHQDVSAMGSSSVGRSYSYDEGGYLTQLALSSGLKENRLRDVRGNTVKISKSAGDEDFGSSEMTWHSVDNLPLSVVVKEKGGAPVVRREWSYADRGRVSIDNQIDLVSGTNRNINYYYCEQSDLEQMLCPYLGALLSVNGSRTDAADITTYTYYPTDDATCATSPTTCPHRKGDLWKVTNALGQVTETLRYDGAGRVLSVKDANGVITDLEYHPRGWLTARKVRGTDDASEADDQVTRIAYWPTGLVKQVTQPDGTFTAYEYDAAHRLVAIADNAGNRIEYLLDNAGNRVKEDTKDANGTLTRTLSRVYNQLGQLATVADAQANPTDFGYDANGNTTSVTDTLGRETRNEYDPLNRLKRTLQDVGGIAAETTFEYDALDNLTQVTDPKGLTTTYTYNGLGDLLQLSSPDTGTTHYTYDSAGSRATQTDARGVTTGYSYDALNRLTAISYPDSSLNVTYVYDIAPPVCTAGETFAVGRLTAMTDGSGSTQYCYDRFGNMVRKVQATNGVTFVLRYAYTKSGQLQHMVYPDGAVVDYVRNAQGNITEVGVARAGQPREVLLHQASYHPFGPVAGWTYGNGRTMLRSLDQDYRPLAVQDPANGGLSLGFGFDAVGNLTQLSSGSPPPISFVYDALGRLTETRDGPTQVATDTYSYDKTGNRTAHTTAAGTSAYGYPATSHRLTDVAGVIRAYDEAGNTLNIAAKEFVYNDANRMSQVRQAGVAMMNYAYNGRGEQVRKHLGTSNTYTLYDEAGHWLGDYDSSGNVLQQALWMDDLPVGLVANNNQLHYVQPDHLGTPRTVIEVARNVPVWAWDLKGEAFGNTAPDQNPDGDAHAFVFDMRFPGQRFDAVSGLNQNYFRDYESRSGRYVQSDPIGLGGGPSTYGYVLSTPLVAADPFGLQTTADTWCRQNPAACVAIFGTGSAITVLPKPQSITLPETGSGEKCKTCAEVYPEYDECSEMSRYYPYASVAHALLDFPAGSKKRPGMPATGGLCAMKGTHHTVFLHGAYVGSIFSCRCCTNTGGGPVLGEIWGNNVGR